jgi:hypothetical protein
MRGERRKTWRKKSQNEEVTNKAQPSPIHEENKRGKTESIKPNTKQKHGCKP